MYVKCWSLLNWRNVRFQCGSVAVAVNWLFVFISSFLRYLRTLYIVWSLVRRRVTRRLNRLQTMYNVLKHRKNDEIKTKSQFTAIATEPHRNCKFRQFKKDQYCTLTVCIVICRFGLTRTQLHKTLTSG